MSSKTILAWMMGLVVVGMAAAAVHNLIEKINEWTKVKKKHDK
ncbi:hypothetical protein [Xylocopilactobacillus apis]|uniref:Uncharacterized protein n=1 Tax=Xylocopilactobacillus apis TaxID=2932183 RepID=A0AAU9DSZ2_9LACO|nr:hypothetical protein [Xylocopilactobacillus apis]BDR56853.1 hypothetical protein KIMC2_14150 [Xylocopilactobacillus apis]